MVPQNLSNHMDGQARIDDTVLVKGTQAWDSFEFFWRKSKPYMTLVKIRKKIQIFFFDFCQNFDV